MYNDGENDQLVTLIKWMFVCNLDRYPTLNEYNDVRKRLLNGESSNEIENELVLSEPFNRLRNLSDIGDLTDNVYIIFGASTGTGFVTACELAYYGATVHICARTQEIFDYNKHAFLQPSNETLSLPREGRQTDSATKSNIMSRIIFTPVDCRNESAVKKYLGDILTSDTLQNFRGTFIAMPGHPGQPNEGHYYDEANLSDDYKSTPSRFSDIDPAGKYNGPWNGQNIATNICARAMAHYCTPENNLPIVIHCSSDGFMTGSELGSFTQISDESPLEPGSGIYITSQQAVIFSTFRELLNYGINIKLSAVNITYTNRLIPSFGSILSPYSLPDNDLLRKFWYSNVDFKTVEPDSYPQLNILFDTLDFLTFLNNIAYISPQEATNGFITVPDLNVEKNDSNKYIINATSFMHTSYILRTFLSMGQNPIYGYFKPLENFNPCTVVSPLYNARIAMEALIDDSPSGTVYIQNSLFTDFNTSINLNPAEHIGDFETIKRNFERWIGAVFNPYATSLQSRTIIGRPVINFKRV